MFDDHRPPSAPLSTARSLNGIPKPRRQLRVLIGVPEQICGWFLAAVGYVVTLGDLEAASTGPSPAPFPDRTDEAAGGVIPSRGQGGAGYRQTVRRSCMRGLLRLQHSLDDHSLLSHYDRLTTMIQRGRRGWGDDDLWGLDNYLTGVLSGAVRQIADLSFGWSDRLWPSHEEWVADLRRLADNLDWLHAHLDEHGALSDPQAEAVCDEVFAMLRKAYGHLRVD